MISLLANCKSSKSEQDRLNEIYEIATVSINHLTDKRLSFLKEKNRDTIILYPEIENFNLEDFKKNLEYFQTTKKANLNIPKCADSIYHKFKFLSLLPEVKILNWDIEKIGMPKVIKKDKSKITMFDYRLELSKPILKSNHKQALILVDFHNSGKWIYYLEKNNGIWEVNCEVQISAY